MKILKVKSLNINSLKGKFEIDFQDFLKDESLFVITGPTGAGKSTILDIITCALYGKTPRLKNPPNELMSRHTGECLCEVEFEVNGIIYRSSWSQKRARKNPIGKFQTAKMELSDVATSKVIKSTLKDVPKYVEELSGLDFDRFKQSMVLAQGGFDAFLKADEKERSTLLEKMTGTQIYKKISLEIYSKYSKLKSDIEVKEKILDSKKLLDIDKVEEIVKNLEIKKKQKQEFDNKINKLITDKTWLETLLKLELDNKKYTELFLTASKEKEDKKEEFQKLELANKALNVQTIYSQQTSLEIDIKKDDLTYTQLVNDLEVLKNRLIVIQSQYKLSQEEAAKTKTNFDIQIQKIKEVRTLQTQIDEKQKSLNSLEQKISIKKEDQEKLLKTQIQINKEFENITKELNIIKEYLNKNKTDETLIESLPLMQNNIKELDIENSNLEELLLSKEDINKKESEQKTIYDELNLKVKELKDIYDLYEKEYKELEIKSSNDSKKEKDLRDDAKKIEALLIYLKEHESLNKKIKNEKHSFELNTKDQTHLSSNIKIKQTLVDELTKYIVTLREKREQELLIKKYEDDREKLKEGQECFLCGSKEHPYIENHINLSSNTTSILIGEKENELKKHNMELKGLNLDLVKVGVKINSSTLELEELQKQKDLIVEIFKNKSVELNNNTKINLEEKQQFVSNSLTLIIKTREAKEKLLKQRDISSKNYTLKQKEFQEVEKELTQIISSKKQLLKDETKLNKKINILIEQLIVQYKAYNVVFNIDTYKEDFNTLKNRKIIYQTNQLKIKEYESKLNQININKKENDTKLLSFKSELKTDTKNKDEHQDFIQELKIKSIEILNVADINAYEVETNSILKQAQEKEHKLNQELTTLKTKEEELSKQEKILKEKLTSSKQTLKELKTKVLIELKNNDFKTLESFINAILSKEKRQELSVFCKTLDNKYNEYQTLKINTLKALEDHKKQNIVVKPIDEVNSELQELQLKVDELQLGIGALSQTLKQNEQDNLEYQEKIQELKKKKEVYKIWVKLNDMAGSFDGSKFAKFAQGITLDQLISLANNHLIVLSNRYELQRGTNQKQLLEIEVIDGFQGDVVRPVSTLSGGESFIVSLSLALGLSELASQKIAIDSLFLDEGFGTLDANSLETALNALNLLQSNGKMIGIISHVEALKERIPLQIKVLPKGDGTSMLDLN